MKTRIELPEAVDRIVSCIPETMWPEAKEHLISKFVDEMDCAVLFEITGDRCGDDKAEAILNTFYEEKQTYEDLIEDSLRILGLERTVYVLEELVDSYSN